MTSTTLKLPEVAFTPIGSEVLQGLTSHPKSLSPWLFYDREGSRLFEAITDLPEYYLTRTERNILAQHATEIVAAAAAGSTLTVFELGAGTATKTGLLLKAAVQMQGRLRYHAIDVSRAALIEAKVRLEAELPGVTVEPQVADYTTELGSIGPDHPSSTLQQEGRHRRLVLYIGSSIGNFAPHDALALLREVRARLGPGDGLLLGVDMVKDKQILLEAYNDRAGVTAAFNKNVLVRLNRELDARFDPGSFDHRAIWNHRHSRIEMHLKSRIAQEIVIAGLELDVRFERGETIHTENSYKFTDEGVLELLRQVGFAPVRRWNDDQNWFGVYLARAC